MGKNNIIIPYKIRMSLKGPQSTPIQTEVERYRQLYLVYPENNIPHYEIWWPQQNALNAVLPYFWNLQKNAIDFIFDEVSQLDLNNRDAYSAYYTKIFNILSTKALLSDSADPTNELATFFYVYQSVCETLHQYQSEPVYEIEGQSEVGFEKYSAKLKKKRILNATECGICEEQAKKHTELANDNFDSYSRMKEKLDKEIDTQSTSHQNMQKTADTFLAHYQAHAQAATLLRVLASNSSITKPEYLGLFSTIRAGQVPSEAEVNNRTLKIASKMIEVRLAHDPNGNIRPAYNEIQAKVDKDLEDFVHESLRQFIAQIGAHIKTLSAELEDSGIDVQQMVLKLNIYFKIFRNIIIKLPIIALHDSSADKRVGATIQYKGRYYSMGKMLDGEYNDDAAIFKEISDAYQSDLTLLKNYTDKFLNNLVKDVNAYTAQFLKNPSKALVEDIITRLTAHDQCLAYYRELFPETTEATLKSLSKFTLGTQEITSASAFLNHLLRKIESDAMAATNSYQAFHGDDQLRVAIQSFVFFSAAHRDQPYSHEVTQHINNTRAGICNAAAMLIDQLMKKLEMADHVDLISTMVDVYYVSNFLNHHVLKELGKHYPSKEDLLLSMLTALSKNPHRRNEIHFYEQLSLFLQNANCQQSMSTLLMNVFPYPETPVVENTVLEVDDLIPESNAHLNQTHIKTISLLLRHHPRITQVNFGNLKVSATSISHLVDNNPQVQFFVFNGQVNDPDSYEGVIVNYDSDDNSTTLSRTAPTKRLSLEMTMTPAKYRTAIDEAIEAIPQNADANSPAARSIPPMFSQYMKSMDLLNEYTDKSILVDHYNYIKLCLSVKKVSDLILEELAKSACFARQCSLSTLNTYPKLQEIPLNKRDGSPLPSAFEKFSKINFAIVLHIMKAHNSDKVYPLEVLKNHILILINNPVVQLLNPIFSANEGSNVLITPQDYHRIFINTFIDYLNSGESDLDFIDNITLYLNHIISSGMELAVDQIFNILSVFNNMARDKSRERIFRLLSDQLAIVVGILPDLSEQTETFLMEQVSALALHAAEHRTASLIEAFQHNANASLAVPENCFDAYDQALLAQLQKNLPESQAICSHFDKKFNPDRPADSTRYRDRDNFARLTVQREKLDSVVAMISRLLTDTTTQPHIIYANTISYIRGQDHVLADCIIALQNQHPNKDQLETLREGLVLRYDRFMHLVFTRYIKDMNTRLKASSSAEDIRREIEGLTNIITFLEGRYKQDNPSDAQIIPLVTAARRHAKAQSSFMHRSHTTLSEDALFTAMSTTSIRLTKNETYRKLLETCKREKIVLEKKPSPSALASTASSSSSRSKLSSWMNTQK